MHHAALRAPGLPGSLIRLSDMTTNLLPNHQSPIGHYSFLVVIQSSPHSSALLLAFLRQCLQSAARVDIAVTEETGTAAFLLYSSPSISLGIAICTQIRLLRHASGPACAPRFRQGRGMARATQWVGTLGALGSMDSMAICSFSCLH